MSPVKQSNETVSDQSEWEHVIDSASEADQEKLDDAYKMLSYIPNPGLAQAHADNRPIRAVFGGNRSGKTVWGMSEVGFWAYAMHPYLDWVNELPRPVNIRICCTSFAQGIKGVIIPTIREWWPRGSYNIKEDRYVEIWEEVNGIKTLMSTVELMCFSGHMPAMLPDGSWKNIKDLNVGDLVQTRFGSKRVNKVFKYDNAPVYQIRLWGGHRIVCTGNHRHLTKDGDFVRTDWLDPGDVLQLADTERQIDDPEEEWRIGWTAIMIGDGCLRAKTPFFTSVNKKVLGNLPPLPPTCHIQQRPSNDDTYFISTSKNKGNPLKAALVEDGLWNKKSGDKFVPSWVFRQPKEQIKKFLEYLWGTDGTHSDRQSRYFTTSEELAYGVKHLIEILGYTASVNKRVQYGGYSRKEGTSYFTVQTSWSECRWEHGRIRKIEEYGTDDVYCVEIEDVHELIVDNIVTSNSYDQDLDKFGGQAKHLIWCDEEPPYGIWQENMMRLLDTDGYMLLTMTPIHGMCFDKETEVLSEKGWVNYEDLSIGDKLLSFNKETKNLEWKETIGLYVNKAYMGDMISLHCQGFDAFVTPDHKWPVISRSNGLIEERETQDLKQHHKIIRAVDNNIDSIKIYEDWFVNLIGWVVTDGHIRKDRTGINITQSLTRYPNNCSSIDAICANIKESVNKRINKYGPEKDKDVITWTIKDPIAKIIRMICPGRQLTSEFILSLTKSQQIELYETLISGDGSRNSNGDRFSQPMYCEETMRSFEILCVLLGKRCTVSQETIRTGTVMLRAHIQTSKRYGPYTNVASLNFDRQYFEGTIWCPHNNNSTVIARRNGTIYITQQTWVYEDLYLSPDTKHIGVYSAHTLKNPHLSQKAIGKIKSLIHNKDDEAIRLYGEFIPASHFIYPMFSQDVHVVDPLDVWNDPERPGQLPDDWMIVVGIDPHDRTPHGVIFCGIDREGDIYVFDEITEHCLISDLAQLIKQKLQGRIPAYSMIDSSALTESSIAGRSMIQEFAKPGNDILVLPSKKGRGSVLEGIQKARDYLHYEVDGADNIVKHPKLKIFRNCVSLIREFRLYVWEDWKGVNRARKDPKESPLKKDDHLLDALRYVLMTEPVYRPPGLTARLAEGLSSTPQRPKPNKFTGC